MEFLNQASIEAAAVVVIVQELIKMAVPSRFTKGKWAVATNLALSAVVTGLLVFPQVNWSDWNAVAAHVGLAAVIAGTAYKVLVKPAKKA